MRTNKNTHMKQIIIAAMLIASLPALSQDIVRFRATGVTCSMCSRQIHSAIKSGDTAALVQPNLQTQQWRVVYPRGTFDKTRLVNQVRSAGFDVAEVWLNDSLVYRRQEKRPRR